ncbi:uncharacterized protein BX664DRAFT_329623 [Halteromyces radiatus]|uniref:uncharacterized protein n=1 Tax=Halteromyces radiatus TaxID=101107 RepID=UPI00221F401D|nr:uncharacterized protein BX664DRAFT_329623 [Halteromyces radiatus]KAI8093399.1 hypothetical protein BX664DRAFT_329623 [Halteromyces radiatus]
MMTNRSSLTNAPPHRVIVTPESFDIGPQLYRYSKTDQQKRQPTKAKWPKASKVSIRQQQQQQKQQQQRQQRKQRQTEEDENIPLEPCRVLDGVTIYIDKSVVNKERLTRIARSLAAKVLENWNTTATHLIHGIVSRNSNAQRSSSSTKQTTGRNKDIRTPHIITKSLEKKMLVVSPVWLITCFDKKERMPECFFPYNMYSDPRTPTLTSASYSDAMEQMENPFGLSPDEFGIIETEMDDDTDDHGLQDKRLTDYYHLTESRQSDNNSNNDNHTDNGHTTSNYTDNNHTDNYHNYDDDNIINNQCNDDHPRSTVTVKADDFDDYLYNNTDNNTRRNDDDDENSLPYSLLQLSSTQSQKRPHDNTSRTVSPDRPKTSYPSRCYSSPSATSTEMNESKMETSKINNLQEIIDMYMHIGTRQTMLRKYTTNGQSSSQKDNNKNDSDNDDDDNAVNGNIGDIGSVLPYLDPAKLPKTIVGREDRLRIWYGEQSFHLDDEDGNGGNIDTVMGRSSFSKYFGNDDVVDLTNSFSNSPPSRKPTTSNRQPAKLTTLKSTTSKKLKTSTR